VVNSEPEKQDVELDVPLDVAEYPTPISDAKKSYFDIDRHKAEQESKINEQAL